MILAFMPIPSRSIIWTSVAFNLPYTLYIFKSPHAILECQKLLESILIFISVVLLCFLYCMGNRLQSLDNVNLLGYKPQLCYSVNRNPTDSGGIWISKDEPAQRGPRQKPLSAA